MKKHEKLFHFEIYHFFIILIIVVVSQTLIPIINNYNTEKLISRVMDYYRWDVAERMADQTTSAMELLFQRVLETPNPQIGLEKATIEAIDFIIFQQNLQRSIDDFAIILGKGKNIRFYSAGAELFNAVVKNKTPTSDTAVFDTATKQWYTTVSRQLFTDEATQYKSEKGTIFYFLVPFSLKGEVVGAVYMKINPELGVIESAFIRSFRQTGALFSILIFMGLLAMFVMTNYLKNERDAAQELLYKKREKKLTLDIESRKENMFVRRIYHAHHKMEKIIGFIKQDIQKLPEEVDSENRTKINKYINFIGRVIYDMKTINPPLSVIRSPNFRTDINEVLNFIIQHIFRRVYKEGQQYQFVVDCEAELPQINVNEFVVWEILEPLINNAVQHNNAKKAIVTITSSYDQEKGEIHIQIKDNGLGIDESLLAFDENGVKKLFLEHSTTQKALTNSGYGCYIAYENCKRCGWTLDATNYPGGAVVSIIVPTHRR